MTTQVSTGVGALASLASLSATTLTAQAVRFGFNHTAAGAIGTPVEATFTGTISAEL